MAWRSRRLSASRWSPGGCSTAPTAGGFAEHAIPLNDANRRAGLEALEIVDRAIELGFLPAGAGGTRVHLVRFPRGLRPRRSARASRAKPPEPLGDLDALREMP